MAPKSSATGFAAVIIINVVTGMIMPLVTWSLRLGNTKGLRIASDSLRYIFSPFAIFPYARGLLDLIKVFWLRSN